MKKILSLALAFTVNFIGLLSLPATNVRAQEVASVSSISKLREQYERLLAVERDPSTTPEVRELNRTILEQRRAQLVSAIRSRIESLRTYRASLLATLTDEERRAVEGSIRKLVEELQSLQPSGDAQEPAATRPARRPQRAAQPKPEIQQASFDNAANAKASSAGASADSPRAISAEPEPSPEPRPAGRAAAIEITSPARDKTVHVAEVEVEVSVNDEDIDDIMAAVYTQSSGQKPATARTLELKRSDHGKKTFPVALEAGANRIEVSDFKRGEVVATRTLTYVPSRDVLNAPLQSEEGSAHVTESLLVKKLKKADEVNGDSDNTNDKAVICGQLQLASLNRTFALIRSTPALGDLAARFLPPETQRRNYNDQIIKGDAAIERMRDTDPTHKVDDDNKRDNRNYYLIKSQFDDSCSTSDVPRDGLQRSAAIDLLKAVLLRLNANLVPKDTSINRAALRNETAYLLETTTTETAVANAASAVRGGGATDAVKPEDLKLNRNSAFSSLSADTIRKQIVLLEEYLGNVEVKVTDGDNVVDQVYADRDGNYVLTFPADAAKTYTISTAADENFTTRQVMKIANGEKVRVNLDIEDRPVSLLARSLIGFSQSGAAASKRDWNYFFDFYVSKSFPFKQPINPDFGERLRLWGDFRIDSLPQSADVTVSDFAGSGLTTGIKNLKVKDVARVFEFLGGMEFRLTGNNALLPSFDRQTKQKFSISFIAAGGFVTPLVPEETAPTIFKVFNDAPGLPKDAKGKEFVAFVPSDRDRFFRQYNVGLRVQTFFFNKYNIPLQRFPAQFDVTVGQNEFVTGGRLHGPVVRMEGFFPLPFEPVKFVNLFATAQMIPGHPRIGTPLILEPAAGTVTVPASNVALIAVPQPNRDHYRIGFSVDAIPIIKRIMNPPTPSTPSTDSGNKD